MQFSTALLDDATRVVGAFHGADVGSLTHGQLLEAHHAAARARRAADLLVAALAGEIAQRSVAGGLARAEGFSSPQRLIASITGGSLADAHRLVEAGTLLAEGEEEQPSAPNQPASVAPEPPLAAALRAGQLGVEAAALIRSTLTRIRAAAESGLADVDTVPVLEAKLVAFARTLSLAELRRACDRVEANASPAAWELRERRQHQARCMTVGSDAQGMVVVTAKLDPSSAAPVIAWLDGQVRDTFQRRREQSGQLADNRTAGQIRADSLVSLARHGLGCDAPVTAPTTTVIVRLTLDQLRSGLGVAECDGLAAPLSATTARRMAADAEVIPVVLGEESEVLDVGRARRLFTRAQRLALVERDDGCAWCHAPPSFCDAHHIRWWTRDAGPTDLSNGVLLCVSCHHRLHDAGWEVRVDANRVYFVPPAGVDPARTPRLGGRARLEQPVAA